MLSFEFKRFQNAAGKLAVVCLVAVLSMPVVVYADGQTEPAVSDINAKVSVEGGRYDNEESFIGLGSLTIPLGQSFGFQVDGAVGRIDDETLLGGGAHLFTRDPSKYLFGVYASYHDWNSINIWRTAAEAELYLDRFSLIGLAGFESVDVPNTSGGLLVLNTDDDHFFGHADLAFYPGDDVKFYAGYRYVNETSLGAVGFEQLLRGLGSPISLFAEGKFGENDYNQVTGGLKIYFGGDKNMTLIRRHRTQDPTNWTPVFPVIQTMAPSAEPPIEETPQ